MADKIHHIGKGGANNSQDLYVFHCPGCEYGHPFEVPRWSWNGSLDKPTFQPSLLVYGSPEGGTPRCHSYVTDGNIQFLNDCTHKLAGQTVEIPDWDD